MKLDIFKNKNTWVAASLLIFSLSSIYLLGDSIQGVYSHYRQMFGPVFWLFILLSAVLLSSVGQVLTGCYSGDPTLSGLKFVEAAGPSAGLLGTVLALMNGFSHLNLSGDHLEAAINGIVHTIAVSLSTTAYGLILSLLAWSFRSCVAPFFVQKWQQNAEKIGDALEAGELKGEVCDVETI